jgi:hypothetical protein
MRHQPRLDFHEINAQALSRLSLLLMGWLPGGKVQGQEYVARNPRRDDRTLGSFSINTVTGKWCDFASGDRGGDPISLYAYLRNLGQGEAARELARELGVDHGW